MSYTLMLLNPKLQVEAEVLNTTEIKIKLNRNTKLIKMTK